jgi:hypothetical protein
MTDDSNIEIRFGASTDEALAGIAKVRDALSGLAAPIGSIGGSLDQLSEKFSGALSPSQIQQCAGAFADMGKAAEHSSTQVKNISNEIKLLREGLAEKKVLFDAEAKEFQITQDKKFALLEQETQKEYFAERDLLQKKIALGNLSAQEQAAIKAKIDALDAKHNVDMLKLDEQSIAAQQALWNGYLSKVTGAFNSQLRGLLEGTTTWKKASVKILEDLTIKFIEMAETTVVKWLSAEIAKTTATTTGALARAEAEQTASSVGILAIIADALKSIYASGGKAGAEVAAAVAPEAGPAAPAIGAAAGAAVVASAIGMMAGSKFDLGTDYVLRGGLAMIHQGETIVPAMARGTGPFTGAGMGGTVHAPVSVNISALDSRSVERFFHDNAKHMIRAINNGIKSGAHLGLRGARA